MIVVVELGVDVWDGVREGEEELLLEALAVSV